MKLSILGAGAMGSLYGGYLSGTGHQVILYDINKEHIEAVRTRGLVIQEGETSEQTVWHPEASTDPESVEGSDIAILFVKSTATREVVRQFAPLLPRESIMITLQNGYGNEEIIRSELGADRTAAGVTSQGATFLGPGKIRHAGSGPTYIGMSDRENSRLNPLADLFRECGFETHISDTVENLVWSKLIINVGINALTAVTGMRNGQLLESEETKSFMKDLVMEAVGVVEKKDIQLQYADPVDTVFGVAEKTGLNRSSMLQDFDKNRPTEIDFINGAIVKEAEKLGIPVPLNRAVTRLVKGMEWLHRQERE
jgi:2-dehydropantoate 2-reductase